MWKRSRSVRLTPVAPSSRIFIRPLFVRLLLRFFVCGGVELLVFDCVVDHDLTVATLSHAIDGVEADLRAAVPIATTVYIEPDIRHQVQS